MQTISGFPYFEVQFNKEGGIHDEDEVTQILNFLPEGNITDLFVISHGWNNNMEEARSLYKNFFALIRTEVNNNRLPGIEQRKFAVLGILWPSMKFAEKELIPGGAAGLGQTEEEEMGEWLESLKGCFDNPDADARIEKAKQLVNLIRNDTDAGRELIDLIRSLPHKNEIHFDDASDQFFTIPGDTLVDILSRPDLPVATEDTGGAAAFDASIGSSLDSGGALGFNIFGGITSAVRKVLNFTTYYQMKERAGVVGRTGAYQVLKKIRNAHPTLKVHLIGHSFGGRLVTALD